LNYLFTRSIGLVVRSASQCSVGEGVVGEHRFDVALQAIDGISRILAAYSGHRDHTNRRIAITRFAAWRSERSDVLS
jgi:hypothetical protein